MNSCSAVNPNLRARSRTVHLALRECRPSRRFVFEALSAGPGLRPVAVFALRERAPRACFPHPNSCPNGCGRCLASCSASGANIGGRSGPSLSAAGMCSNSEDCRDHLAASPAILHPRFRRRVLPGFRPVAVRISKFNSASEHARTKSPPNQIRHSHWVETSASSFLDLPTPPLPASDFIGHIIFWDQQTTRAMACEDRGRHRSRLGRSAVPDPRILGIHAVRLFRTERRQASPAATPSPRARRASAIGISRELEPASN